MVRRLHRPQGELALGLWLSHLAAHELSEAPDGPARLRDWLHERGLVVTTLNAFPYHAFHGPVVKHQVYEPDWADARRLIYTTQLADLLPTLLPAGAASASISTLPVGWRARVLADRNGASLGVASAHLQQLARHLDRLEDRTGVRIHVDLEPEPGCLLDHAQDAVKFLEPVIAPRGGSDRARRYIGVCHDVCHAAVMFEGQRAALDAYRAAGIRVGKVQVSSAPACTGAPDELAVLASFAEPRYLHQTCVRTAEGVRFFEDLPAALEAEPVGEWRTHFHVPVFAERFGAIGTTQAEIDECFDAVCSWPIEERPQFEVETYAWDVLPANLGVGVHDALAQGIASELQWTEARLARAAERARGARA